MLFVKINWFFNCTFLRLVLNLGPRESQGEASRRPRTKLLPSSRNSLFDRAVNSFSTPGGRCSRTVIHSYAPRAPVRSDSYFFFLFLAYCDRGWVPGPHQVRLGLCPIKRPSFSTVGAHGFAYFCLERRTSGREARHVAEKRKNSPSGWLLRRTSPPFVFPPTGWLTGWRHHLRFECFVANLSAISSIISFPTSFDRPSSRRPFRRPFRRSGP